MKTVKVVAHKQNIIRLSDCRNSSRTMVPWTTKVLTNIECDTKLGGLCRIKLFVIVQFIEITGIYSSLFKTSNIGCRTKKLLVFLLVNLLFTISTTSPLMPALNNSQTRICRRQRSNADCASKTSK